MGLVEERNDNNQWDWEWNGNEPLETERSGIEEEIPFISCVHNLDLFGVYIPLCNRATSGWRVDER